jgi:FAD/FMN-containing dehydrogenase
LLAAAVGADHVLAAGDFAVDYCHDESLGVPPGEPALLVRPGSTAEVAAVLRAAAETGLRVTARGAGTGMSGAANPGRGGADIVDAVVPRAAMAAFFADVTRIAAGSAGGLVAGCGHAGDGNVHLAVFQPDRAAREALLREIFAAAIAQGGAVSGEHGIGMAKREYFLELADPVAVALMRRVKQAFDPQGTLGPGTLFGEGAS